MYENHLNEILNSEYKAYELLDLIDNEEFEKELIDFTQTGVKEAILKNFPSERAKKLTMFALTFIAMKYYDGGLWSHFCEKFKFLGYEYKIVEAKIRDNVLSQFTVKYHCERKHYQIPVMNSLIPLEYAANYIEFVNDIYTRNLDCDLSAYKKELDEELENIFNAIKDKLSDNDDSFNYNYEKSNKKTYKLIRATKNIIKTGVKRQELILVTKEILKKLDAFYNGKNIISNQYVEKAFSVWFKENKDRVYTKREKTNFKKSKFPYFTFIKETGNVYLNTPVKRLYGDYDKSLFSIEIYEGERLIERTTNLKIQSLLGGIEIMQCDYKLQNPLSKIKCIIKYDNEEVYSSRDNLYKEYMIFNDSKELKNNKSYSGLVYVLYKKSFSGNLTRIKTCENYKIAYNPQVKETDEFLIDDLHKITFSSIRKSGIIGFKNKDFVLIKNEKECKLYSYIESICLVGEGTNKKANKIRIDNKFVDLYEAIEIIQQGNELAYVIDFEKYDIENGLHKIELVNIVDDKVLDKYRFVYDDSIETSEALISNCSIEFKYSGSYNLVDANGEKYNSITLNINTLEYKKYYLKINEQFLQCRFALNVPHYTINDEYIYTFNESLNSEKIKYGSRMYFNAENCDAVLYRAGDEVNELSIKTIDKRTYVEISEILNYSNCKYIDICFMAEMTEKYILRVYFDVVYDEENSYYSVDAINQQIEFKTSFYGKKINEKLYLRAKYKVHPDPQNKQYYEFKVIYAEEIKEGTPNIIQLDSKIKKVYYEIYRTVKETVGFKINEKEDVVYRGKIPYYPISGLINKYLVIEGVRIDEENEECLETIDLNLKAVRRIDDFYYLGYLYDNKNWKLTSFDKIGAVKIYFSQVYSEGDDSYCDADISIYFDEEEEDWNVLLQYDESKKTILNGSSKTAPHILSYKINLSLGERRYKEYARFKSNKESQIYRKRFS